MQPRCQALNSLPLDPPPAHLLSRPFCFAFPSPPSYPRWATRRVLLTLFCELLAVFALSPPCSARAWRAAPAAPVSAGEMHTPQRPGTPHPAAGSAVNPAAVFAQGQAALDRGDLAAAETAFRRVLVLDPNAGSAYANLGVVAMRRKQWDSALALLRKAEKLNPKMAGIRLNIALVQFHRGDYSAAIPALQSVVRDEPQSEQARYLLGLCQVLTEKFPEAVATLQPLYKARSSDVLYLYLFDIAAHGAGQKELDDEILEQMVRVASDTPEFHLLMGKARLNRQDMPQAIDELQKAAAGKDNLAYVHFELGMAYLMQGKTEEAEAEFRKDISVEPDLPDNYEQLGVLYLRVRQPEKARASFEEALKLDPKRAGPHMQLAQLAFDDHKDQNALREVDAALRLDPNARGARLLRGRILARLGRATEAQAEFAKAKQALAKGLEKDRESLANRQLVDPALKQPPQ